MKKIPFKRFLPGIAWFLVITVLTCLPGSDIPKIRWLDKIYFDKWVHTGLFAALAYLFSFPFFKARLSLNKKINYFILIAITASLYGLAIEFIQKYFVIGRSFDLLDWAADSFGAFLAFLFCRSRQEKYASTANA